MAEQITTAATEIAKTLKALPDVKEAYAYPKAGGLRHGDLCLAISGMGVAETFGATTSQQVVFDCVIRLGSATATGRPKELQAQIARLGSADTTEGIDGLLRSEAVADRLRSFGSPRVTEDGYEVGYGEEEDSGAVVTLLSCQIAAIVTNT